MIKSEENRLFTPSEAVKYLEEKRGIHLSVTALRMRRRRKKVTANRVLGRISLWTKEELDTIEPARQYIKKSEVSQNP